MDPMLELAREFLKAERPDGETKGKFPQDLYTSINEAIRDLLPGFERRIQKIIPHRRPEKIPLRQLQRILWESRDERAQEVLANVFYANPTIARRLCEILGYYPAFIRYLVNEAQEQWQREHSGKEPRKKENLDDLFERFGFHVHERFPEALSLALVEKPVFMTELAEYLNAALPFSLVLKKELDEISKSRQERLRPDPGAKAARRMKNILRLNTSLDRLAAAGSNGALIREKKLLREEEDRMWEESQDGDEFGKAKPRIGFQARVEEFWKWLLGKQLKPEKKPSIYSPIRAEESSLFGLALSGGGIRSATFNLGILQGLADLDLMRRLDYLSGVSGGSHIAGWLAAWIKREKDGIRRVQRWLSPLRSPTPDTDETHPIQFLRRFSNYLAPRKGLLSADTWSIVAVWLRNTLLNQFVFTLLLASLLCIPRLILFLFSRYKWWDDNEGPIGGLAILLTGALAVFIGLNLRHFDRDPQAKSSERKPNRAVEKAAGGFWDQFGALSVAGFGILSLVGSALLWREARYHWQNYKWDFNWYIPYLVIVVGLLIGQLCSRAWSTFVSMRAGDVPSGSQKAKAIASIVLVAGTSSFAGWGMLYKGFRYYENSFSTRDDWEAAVRLLYPEPSNPLVQELARQTIYHHSSAFAIVYGPAFLLGVLFLIIMVYIGLMGRNMPDTRREWWGRFSATLLIAAGVWTAASFCSLYGPKLALSIWNLGKVGRIGSVFFWLATAWFGSRWGAGSQTPSFPIGKDRRRTRWLETIAQTTPREWIARIAPYVYIAGLAISLSFLLFKFSLWWQEQPNLSLAADYWSYASGLAEPWWLFLATLVPAFVLARRFDVNEFSMHNFYLNRLVRCYLGASREKGSRNPNPFTGFDPEDDLSLSVFRVLPPAPKDLSRAARSYYGPFPIFNTALNLVAGKELAWQERKAASFAFTPLYCGYELAPGEGYSKKNYANFGYRPTVNYTDPNSLGPSLGTAMAISGAAANPNMGYHSSPALSFLMALFNFRLGCWVGNTRHRKTWELSSPGGGIGYLVNELIGNTDDTSRFINLSDGGHFDNLGLYELVRRRCMYIIVCDAEEDFRFSFQGLGGAIRKCRADFGIDIRLNPDRLRPVPDPTKEQGRSVTHCAVGEIIYSPETRGKLLYVKTSLTGDEPGDVLEYRLRHQVFPHQSTLDQFFDESQFESYRALGQHIATVILKRAADYSENDSTTFHQKANGPKAADWYIAKNERFLNQMFLYLQAMWYPPTENMREKGEEDSRQYGELVSKFSSHQNGFGAAARTFFHTSRRPGARFLAYSAMIELMYRVFQDMDLETMADHPHNEGWMNMFRGWASDRQFRKAWKATKDNYDIRFRNFCEKELGLDSGRSRLFTNSAA